MMQKNFAIPIIFWVLLNSTLLGAPIDTLSTPGCVGGNIFEDFNCNGIDDNYEPGVQGMLVVVNDNQNNPIDTVQSNSDGVWQVCGLTDGEAYRIEFLLPDSISYWANPTHSGNDNGTDVQFLVAPACASFGLSNPYDYCEANPELVLPCYVNGDPLAGGTSSGEDALVAVNYDASSKRVLATTDSIGAVWGVAQRGKENNIYSSAVLKRHVGYGPLGEGGIYCTNLDNSSTFRFLDVETLGIDVGIDPRDASDPANTLPADRTEPSQDSLAFYLAGNNGIGDLDFSDDGNMLWFTNLNDGQIYSIDLSNGTPTAANVNSCTLPDPCNPGTGFAKPWGLKYYKGFVYVGMVCNAELSQDTSDLTASVYQIDPNNCSPTEIITFPLSYTKGVSSLIAGDNVSDQWHPWVTNWDTLAANSFSSGLINYPQPILSDIEFDDNGDMILGFLDRTGMQLGILNFDIFGDNFNGQDFGGFGTMVGGDVLKVDIVNNTQGILENNGTIAGNTTSGTNNGQGPGGGEFYYDDGFGQHQETSLGALTVIRGTNEVVVNVYDPLSFDSGGPKWLKNDDGSFDRGYTVYSTSGFDGTFGKALGLGDIEAVCTECAPIEIGNYVWCDLSPNGVQDAFEEGVNGMTVQLYDENGLLIGQDVTVNGNYYFNQLNVDTTGINVGGGSPNPNTSWSGLSPNTRYYIVFGNGQFNNTTGEFIVGTDTYEGITVVDANGNGNDNIDSDVDGNTLSTAIGGIPANYPFIELTTDSLGCANHSFDMGVLCSYYDIALTKYVDQTTVTDGSSVTYTLVVDNLFSPVTGAIVSDPLPAGLTYTGTYTATSGTYDGTNWTIGNMGFGQIDSIQITAIVNTQGVITNSATVSINEIENDFELRNNQSDACISVPIQICDDQAIDVDIMAETGYSMYQWYKDGTLITDATSSTYKATDVGVYTYTVDGAGPTGDCQGELCCPIVIEQISCCPPKTCLPITVTKL